MGRRKPAAAFSLFSFQDIITSVSAILILVMLLLTIELVTRRRHQAATDPAVSRRQIAVTAETLERLAGRLREDVAARKAQRPSRSLDMARAERDRAQKELEAVMNRLDETRRAREAARARAAATENEAAERVADTELLENLEQQIKENSRETESLDEANRREKDRQEKRQLEIADAPRSGTELVFNAPADSTRRAWLVELSRDGVAVVLLGGDRTERLGLDTGAASRFSKWLGELSADGDYCLLLVRPSATDDVEREVERRLTDAGIRLGIDLIGEDQTVRDGSKTAAQDSGAEG